MTQWMNLGSERKEKEAELYKKHKFYLKWDNKIDQFKAEQVMEMSTKWS